MASASSPPHSSRTDQFRHGSPPRTRHAGVINNPDSLTAENRVRRAPPPFRRVSVVAVEAINPRLMRITFGGPELDGLIVTEPGASIRLLIPTTAADELVIPTWRGNEFLLPKDVKPAIRTFTPSMVDATSDQLVIDVVLHGRGAASEWAADVSIGDPAAVSGPGRGYTVDGTASGYLIGGDESAIPAIRQLLRAIPSSIPTRVLIEVTVPDARVDLPHSDNTTITWITPTPQSPPGTALADALIAAQVAAEDRVWVAGEAAAVQRVRKHLFTEVGFSRGNATIRGYWKHGRRSDESSTAV